MRFLKVTVVMAAVMALAVSSAFAGPSCSASKQVKVKQVEATTASSCLSTVFAGAGNSCSASKAKLAALVEVETTQLPSGVLVVNYRGKTEDAVAYLRSATAAGAADFCCPLTQRVAVNEDAKVEVAKTRNGAMVVVTSQKPAVLEEYAQSYAQLVSAGE